MTSFALPNQRYKLVRLTPESEEQLKIIREWEHNPEVSPIAYFFSIFDFFEIKFLLQRSLTFGIVKLQS